MNQTVSYTAPASIGNFIVGFDTLGLALAPIDGEPMQDVVTVTEAESTRLEIAGSYASWVPLGEDNLVYQAAVLMNRWLQRQQFPKRHWQLHLQKDLPVASGTGSSAASSVAAVLALSDWLEIQAGTEVPEAVRWRLMSELEASVSGAAHLDNLAPAVLGGLVLCPVNGKPVQLPFFNDWYVVLAYSGQTLKTSTARSVLPTSYSAQQSIEQMQRLASLVDACYRQDGAAFLAALKDHFAEPYRAKLINGYLPIKAELQQAGAKAVGISGAGPAFFAVSDSLEQARKLQAVIKGSMQAGSGAFVRICQAWYP